MNNYRLDGNRRLILDDDGMAILRSINREGNATASEQIAQDIGSRWALERTLPDSHMVALWKIHQLLLMGVPVTPLLFTLCRDQAGELHSVVCTLTNRGDFVLDTGDIVSYSSLRDNGYQILYRSSVGGPLLDLLDAIDDY